MEQTLKNLRRTEGGRHEQSQSREGGITASAQTPKPEGGIVQQGYLLSKLVDKMNGRRPRRMRGFLGSWSPVVHRDPVRVAYRWLRRFAGGEWHRGGCHVARLNYGPGIAFPGFRDWVSRPIKAELLRGEGGGL